MSKKVEISQVAESTPFDNSSNGFIAEDVQAAIEEVQTTLEISASPGFTWGKSGSSKNTYLQNDTVPSNIAGRLCTVDGELVKIFMTNDTTTKTFEVQIRRRELNGTFTTIATMTVSNQRAKIQQYTGVSVSYGDELSCYVFGQGNNSAQDLVVGIELKGTEPSL